jgi:hypothetical protein
MPPAVRILSLTEKVAIPGGAFVNAVELGVGAGTKVSIAQRAPSRAFTLGARGAGWSVAHDTGSKVGVEGVVGGRAGRGGRQALAIDIDAPCLDEACEGAATLGGRERWRQVERVGTERGETILLLDVAERADLGREHRAVHGVVE